MSIYMNKQEMRENRKFELISSHKNKKVYGFSHVNVLPIYNYLFSPI